MVALNYQTEDAALHLNTALFEQTGRYGYVLKPALMWDRSHVMYHRFDPWDKEFDGLHVLHVHLTLISGQYLCPGNPTGSPLMDVEIVGIPVDCIKHKSKMVQRNGLNPVFQVTRTRLKQSGRHLLTYHLLVQRTRLNSPSCSEIWPFCASL